MNKSEKPPPDLSAISQKFAQQHKQFEDLYQIRNQLDSKLKSPLTTSEEEISSLKDQIKIIDGRIANREIIIATGKAARKAKKESKLNDLKEAYQAYEQGDKTKLAPAFREYLLIASLQKGAKSVNVLLGKVKPEDKNIVYQALSQLPPKRQEKYLAALSETHQAEARAFIKTKQ